MKILFYFVLPLCQRRRGQGPICNLNNKLSLFSQRRGDRERKGHSSLFQEWGTTLLRKFALAFIATLEVCCSVLNLRNLHNWGNTSRARNWYRVGLSCPDHPGNDYIKILLLHNMFQRNFNHRKWNWLLQRTWTLWTLPPAKYMAILSRLREVGVAEGGWEESSNQQVPTRDQACGFEQSMFIQHALWSGMVIVAGVNSNKVLVFALRKLTVWWERKKLNK